MLDSLSKYICKVLKNYDGVYWWRNVLSKVSFPDDLPARGTFDELAGSLDIAACFQLLDRRWNDVFRHEDYYRYFSTNELGFSDWFYASILFSDDRFSHTIITVHAALHSGK